MWMSDETQRKAIQSDTFSHIVYCWKANWGSCIVFYFPNFVSFAFLGCFFALWCFFWSCFTISTENVPGWSETEYPICPRHTAFTQYRSKKTFIGYKCIIRAHFLCRGLWAKSRHWLGQHSRYTQTGTAETGIFHFACQLVWSDS